MMIETLPPHPLQGRQLLGILLTSLSALALEIVLTRIFSVTMWYHFAFLAISMALMGSAVAAVAALVFAWSNGRQRWPALVAGLALTGLLWGNTSQHWLAITVNKTGGLEPTPVYERWNAQSRVTVYDVQHYPFFWSVDQAH